MLNHLTQENLRILDWRNKIHRESLVRPELLWPHWRPCKIRVLLLTDRGLYFSAGSFGLSTFVQILLDASGYTRFEITLGHLDNMSLPQMMGNEPRIKDRITNFKFDNPEDFSIDRYDVVFLFGFRSDFSNRGEASDGQPYPSDRLANTELQILGEFQNAGGGLFATGDHGALGKFMGQALPRAGKMRLWDSTSADPSLDEVSMGGPRRNDTNRPGDPGSQFNDQSDDIPQDINPRFYSARNGFLEYRFPHPLLCSPNGIIRVMPDHPHEGECIEPDDPNLELNFKGPLGPEFPPAIDGRVRPLPQIISTNSVLSGTESGRKDPTRSHSFGGICAYDGHRAGIGRVVTDATWHHFVNVNLVGDQTAPAGSDKKLGFLASAQGQAHFEQIKTYYLNLATWLARPDRLRCLNSRILHRLVYSDRVLEAILTTTQVNLEEVHPKTIALIGNHARDVIGRYVGQCQAIGLIIDLIIPEINIDLIPEIDPWRDSDGKSNSKISDVSWINLDNFFDIALGSALLSVNDHIQKSGNEAVDDADVEKLAKIGAVNGIKIGMQSLEAVMSKAKQIMRVAG